MKEILFASMVFYDIYVEKHCSPQIFSFKNTYVAGVPYPWRYDREGDKFCFLSEISIYLSYYFFLYINDFLMVWNHSAMRVLSSITFKTVKGRKEEKQKSMNSEESFSFLKSWNFWNFKTNISMTSKQCSWRAINNFEVKGLFYLNFDTIKNKFQSYCCNAARPGILFAMNLLLHAVLFSESERYIGLNTSYFRW